ncbi:hypothetical protein J0A71_03g06310 [Encephalitozoon cuniculi]|nr:hypothetical protein J0A71_03g06310 [Encephalitozoon cuniculi]
MASQKILSAVDSINDLLKTLPPQPTAVRCYDSFVPKEMAGCLRRRALESTLPLLERIVCDIKSAQEKHTALDAGEMCSRREFATTQLHHLRLSMENEFEEAKINRVKDLLSEIEYYERIGARPVGRINVGKEATTRIFRMLSRVRTKPIDSYIWGYLKRRVCFFHESPSDIEISSLKAMLRLLHENDSEAPRGQSQPCERQE